jgi:hypothetical protein
MFLGVMLIPFIINSCFCIGFYPVGIWRYLTNPVTARIFGFDLNTTNVLLGWSVNYNFVCLQKPTCKFSFKETFLNIVNITAVALFIATYLTMLVLGWLMHRFVKRQMKEVNNDVLKVKQMRHQRRLTFVLLVQVSKLGFL